MFNAYPAGVQRSSAKIVVKGVVADKASLPKDAVNGDLYLTSSKGEAFYYNGKVWKSAGSYAVKGPAGKDGTDGLPGKTGAIGPKGEPGPAGPAGKDGARGLRGPKGDPGLPGKDGLVGPPGKHGINGRDGLNGIDGKNGKQGPVGIKGPKGETGPQGLQGPKGEKGDVGIEYPNPGVVISSGTYWEESIPLSTFIKIADEQNLINKTIKNATYGCSVVDNVVDASTAFLQTLVLMESRVLSLVNFKEGSMVRVTIANRNGFSITWPSIHWVGGAAPRIGSLSVVEIWKSNGQLIGVKL